jgi:hypothetical protein
MMILHSGWRMYQRRVRTVARTESGGFHDFGAEP